MIILGKKNNSEISVRLILKVIKALVSDKSFFFFLKKRRKRLCSSVILSSAGHFFPSDYILNKKRN